MLELSLLICQIALISYFRNSFLDFFNAYLVFYWNLLSMRSYTRDSHCHFICTFYLRIQRPSHIR